MPSVSQRSIVFGAFPIERPSTSRAMPAASRASLSLRADGCTAGRTLGAATRKGDVVFGESQTTGASRTGRVGTVRAATVRKPTLRAVLVRTGLTSHQVLVRFDALTETAAGERGARPNPGGRSLTPHRPDPVVPATQAERAAAAYRVLGALMRAIATELGAGPDADLLRRLADSLAGPSPARPLRLVPDLRPGDRSGQEALGSR